MKYSLSKSVGEVIDRHPYLKYALSEGIVNYSALARKLLPLLESRLNRKVNEDSLIVAIKRYADGHSAERPANVRELIGKGSLSMQNGVCYALVRRTPDSFKAVDELFEEIDWGFDEIRTIVGSASHLVVLLRSDRMGSLLEKLDESTVEEICEDKALVTVKLPKDAFRMHGVLNEMTSTIAKKGISIDLFCVPPDIHFIVDEEDAERTYQALRELIKSSKVA